jgi:hypothetical protein
MKQVIIPFANVLLSLLLCGCGSTITAIQPTGAVPGVNSFKAEATVKKFISGPVSSVTAKALFTPAGSGTTTTIADGNASGTVNPFWVELQRPNDVFKPGDKVEVRWKAAYTHFGTSQQATTSDSITIVIPNINHRIYLNPASVTGGQSSQGQVRLNFATPQDILVELQATAQGGASGSLDRAFVTIPRNSSQSEFFTIRTDTFESPSGYVVGVPSPPGIEVTAKITLAGQSVSKREVLWVQPTSE